MKAGHVAIDENRLAQPEQTFGSIAHVLGASIPFVCAFDLHTIMSWLQIHIRILVGALQVADIRGGAVELDCIFAAFASNPFCSGPLANAPCGLISWACNLAVAIIVFATPAGLPRELPKRGVTHPNLCADSMSVVMIALSVATSIARAT